MYPYFGSETTKLQWNYIFKTQTIPLIDELSSLKKLWCWDFLLLSIRSWDTPLLSLVKGLLVNLLVWCLNSISLFSFQSNSKMEYLVKRLTEINIVHTINVFKLNTPYIFGILCKGYHLKLKEGYRLIPKK